MGFHVLKTSFNNVGLVLLTICALKPSLISTTTSPAQNSHIAKPDCVDRCGDIRIPYPFGTTEGCYQDYSFFVTCNQTAFDPPKLFVQDSNIEIIDISLDGQLKLMQFVAYDCYAPNGSRDSTGPWISIPSHLTINNTANKFTIVGCDTYGFVYGRRLNRNYTTGCTAVCEAKEDLVDGSCMGSGCCQTSIPQDVWEVEIELDSYENYSRVSDFNNCGYAFLAEESAFNFSSESLTSLRNVEMLPMVADWAIGNETCEEAMTNNISSYACVSSHSRCYKPDNGYGYRCLCLEGYQGNPYLDDGCQDIDECDTPGLNNCIYDCINTYGGFECPCPKGHHGNGTKVGGGCSPNVSITLKLVAGVAIGVIVLLLAACLLYLELKRRSMSKLKKKFFFQNGGVLLQEKLISKQGSSVPAKSFSSSELKKATNDFHNNMIIGQGGFGTVYKGLLPDNKVVAIKKSKKVDPNQIEQFINEVIVLSQINHRNVVRLLGCCLETEVPLLVYEYVSNGTLSAHIRNKSKAQFFNWDMRLKIAAETAGVLAYLHSAASTPIIHRDVKPDNILLDHTFTAKVSDFGASKLVPLDQTQLSTLVQGTFGYLDPEYMQTNQLTEKSDVYSFGVVLVQLLTGRKAIDFDKPEKEKSLANFFLSNLKQKRLFEVLDENILDDTNKKQIAKVAKLAQGCLNVKGDDRPTMKRVAMELDGLRPAGKHPWGQNDDDSVKVMENLLGDGNSSSVGYDNSIRDHVMLPISGGR